MPTLNGRTVTGTYYTEHRQSQRCLTLTVNREQYARRKVRVAQCECLSTFGQQHHIGCNHEECPVCGGFVNLCGCLNGD